jgi:hypothetical protein
VIFFLFCYQFSITTWVLQIPVKWTVAHSFKNYTWAIQKVSLKLFDIWSHLFSWSVEMWFIQSSGGLWLISSTVVQSVYKSSPSFCRLTCESVIELICLSVLLVYIFLVQFYHIDRFLICILAGTNCLSLATLIINFCRILMMVCWYWTNCTFGLYPSSGGFFFPGF